VGRVSECSKSCHAYHELEYETLCTESHDTFKGVVEFLGLPFTDHTKSLLSKLTPSRIGSYQWLQQRQEPTGKKSLQTLLRKLGLSPR
jgi:hypothetical protein